jgi:transcriptional regulator with XRE-family HTH domain
MDGTELKALRENAGLSQSDLAEIVGCCQKTVSRAEGAGMVMPWLAKKVEEWQRSQEAVPAAIAANGDLIIDATAADVASEESGPSWDAVLHAARAERDLLQRKFLHMINAFNRALDGLAVERIKAGMSIDTAYQHVQAERQECDNGLVEIDAQHGEKADG